MKTNLEKYLNGAIMNTHNYYIASDAEKDLFFRLDFKISELWRDELQFYLAYSYAEFEDIPCTVSAAFTGKEVAEGAHINFISANGFKVLGQ